MSSRIPTPDACDTRDDFRFFFDDKYLYETRSTILCDNISEIRSFLGDSKGYDEKMINSWLSLIRVESLIAEDQRVLHRSFQKDPIIRRRHFEMGTSNLDGLAEITESTGFMKKQLKEIHDVRDILESPQTKQGTTSTGQSFTSLNVFRRTFQIGDSGKHQYDAAVSILQALEHSVSTEHCLPCPFRIEDIQVLYENLWLMDSLLIDSSREVYDKKLTNDLKMWIDDVADTAQDYLDAWVLSCLRKQNSVSTEHCLPCPFRKGDIQVLYENLSLTDSLLIDSSREVYDKKMTNVLKMWVNDVADTAKYYLDAWVLSCLCKPDNENPNTGFYGAAQFFNPKFCRITETIEFIHKQLKRSHDNREVPRLTTQNLLDKTSAGPRPSIVSNMLPKTPNDECKLVGLEEDLVIMLDHLTGKLSKREVLAVTGMGGIGKTTFTRRLYDDPLVKYHFHIRAWFTVSQHYQLREVLLGLLHCIIDSGTDIYECDNEELKEKLYKSLKGMRYLIVLDDMWDKKVWDDLKMIFPDDETGSRIILTSRLTDVATHASPNTPPHCLRPLNDDESWKLLCSKISVTDLCPELREIGEQIARQCQGLPLAIVVVGGLLSKMNKELDVWKDVAQSVSSKVMNESDYCENILALSYNHLPDHLKSCFLYMGTFPEDHKILAKKLMWLWIVEGFIRPGNLKSVEEVAENYLEDLIARSLIQVKRKGSDGKIKICYIHDLLRDLCLKESYKQNFYLAFNMHGQLMKPADKDHSMLFQLEPRRICFPPSTPDLIISPLFPPIRSFLWFQAITLSDPESYFFMNFKLLKVLDITYLHLKELPREISCLANLRYLALSFRKSIDRSIFSSTFHNIQFLIVDGEWNGLLPKEFWAMSELRHFHLKRSFLSYWPKESGPNIMQLASAEGFPQALICQVQKEEHPLKVLQNLQSIAAIRPVSCTEAVFLSMPNLKKLSVYENEEDYLFRGWFNNLIHLKELQTLKYIFRDPFVSVFMKPDRLPSQSFFPQKLMNLTLSGTFFPWEDMLTLSALPLLEVLKLKNYAFAGATWESEEGGFPRLKYIFIGRTNLQLWEADHTHFPSLKHLVIKNCGLLEGIPRGIGEAPLLERIELSYCSESASASAQQILLEQKDNGNDSLIVHITEHVDHLEPLTEQQ